MVDVGQAPHDLERLVQSGLDVDDGGRALRTQASGLHTGLGRLDDRIERAEIAQQGRRGLLADAGGAGQPVRGISAQCGQLAIPPAVGHPVGLGQIGLGQCLPLPALAGPQNTDLSARIEQCQQVPIGGDDDDGGARLRGHGRDDVIGLGAVHLGDGDPGSGEDAVEDRQLTGQFGRDLGARFLVLDPIRLVLGHDRGAEGRSPVRVHRRHHTIGVEAADHLSDGVEHASHGIDRLTVVVDDRIRHRVEGAIVQCGRIEQNQGLHIR